MRRNYFTVTVTAILLATSLLLFVMLGGCSSDDANGSTPTTSNAQQTEPTKQHEPIGTVVVSPTENEEDPGSIEIVIPNVGDGEDGEEGGNTGSTGNTGNTSDPTTPTQSGSNTQTTRPTDPTLPTQSGDGDTEQGGNENNGPVGEEDERVDLEVDFDDLWN